MYPLLQMPKEQHRYKPNTTFDQVMMLYRFDKKLRLLIFNEIEKIEVAVRSAIVNIGSDMTGNPFWMTDGSNFIDAAKFRHTMDLIDAELHRSREDFIVHFKQTYSDAYPPAWILAEVLPFGVITNIFSNIKTPRIKKSIARKFGLQVAPFESWLTIVTLTRNSCCHHARVWNKQNTIRPMLPNRMTGSWITLPTDALRIYFNLCIIKYFLNIISPNNDMKAKVDACSPLTRPSTSPPWASLADGRANLCGINHRFTTLLFQIFTKPLNICSDFHLGRHFFGLVGGFFVGFSVTLWLK